MSNNEEQVAGQSPLEKLHHQDSLKNPVDREQIEDVDRPGAPSGGSSDDSLSRLELEYLPWGTDDAEGATACRVLATCGWVELEYAIMRRGCGMLDQPNRGTVVLSGDDRQAVLENMVSQGLEGLSPTSAREAFLTDRKGRVQADLLIAALDEEILLDVDINQVDLVTTLLSDHIFTEDVQVRNGSEDWYRIGVHGPDAASILGSFGDVPESSLSSSCLEIAGVAALAVRRDQVSTPGFELFLPRAGVVTAWEAIRSTGGIRGIRVRTVGWYAFNTARIEGGTPLFNIDFASNNLPHESSLIESRVSFTKGCYPGQEVVARMHHLGAPKQALRGLKIKADVLPVAGSQVFAAEDETLAEAVGVITSSTISPLSGATPIAIAMLKKRVVASGSMVRVHAEGIASEAVVCDLDELVSSGADA